MDMSFRRSPRAAQDADRVPSDFDIFSTPSSPQQGDRRDDLGLEPLIAHEVPPDEEIEELVRAAELDIGLEGHRVVSLRQRIEELVEGDRLARGPALLEIVALEDPRHRDLRGETNEALGAERREPAAVELDHGLLLVQDLERLRRVGLRVDLDLGPRQLRPRGLLAGGSPIIPVKSPTTKTTR
jgi:hypothetical protein